MSDPTKELISAVVIDDSRLVKKCLAAGADPNAYDVLRMANLAIAKLLLEAGADVNLPFDDEENTPLMSAASRGDLKKMQLLLDHGADINLTTQQNALTNAVYNNNVKVAQFLLAAGADPTIRIPRRPGQREE